jgi:hypothetical protein
MTSIIIIIIKEKKKKRIPTYRPTLKNVGQSTSNKNIFNDSLIKQEENSKCSVKVDSYRIVDSSVKQFLAF